MQMIASSSSGSGCGQHADRRAAAAAMATFPVRPRQRRAIGLADVRQRQPDSLEKVILSGPGRRQTQQVLELIEHQQHRGAEREADDHRVRNVARQVAQPQQRDARLDDADDEGQAESPPEFVRHRRNRPGHSARRSRSRWSDR